MASGRKRLADSQRVHDFIRENPTCEFLPNRMFPAWSRCSLVCSLLRTPSNLCAFNDVPTVPNVPSTSEKG